MRFFLSDRDTAIDMDFGLNAFQLTKGTHQIPKLEVQPQPAPSTINKNKQMPLKVGLSHAGTVKHLCLSSDNGKKKLQ